MCITSRGYPADYGNDEHCEITPFMSGVLVVEAFETQVSQDKLTIAGTAYSGPFTPGSVYSGFGPAGVVVDTTTSITWVSDHSREQKGFRICLAAASTAA
eukprot:gene57729-biopygen32747